MAEYEYMKNRPYQVAYKDMLAELDKQLIEDHMKSFATEIEETFDEGELRSLIDLIFAEELPVTVEQLKCKVDDYFEEYNKKKKNKLNELH